MDLQPKDPRAATDGGDMGMANRRTLEFFFLGAVLGIGMPIAILMGVRSGERTAAVIYPNTEPVVIREVDYKSIVMGSPGDEERGRALFQTSCVACHGAMADGKGPAAGALVPPPRNFLDPAAVWSHGRNPLDVYHTISNGSPGTAMVGFSAALSVQDRWAMAHYLSGLPGLKGRFQPIDEAIAASWRPEKAD
jgi:mono/diheme cytochrome c family protein